MECINAHTHKNNIIINYYIYLVIQSNAKLTHTETQHPRIHSRLHTHTHTRTHTHT